MERHPIFSSLCNVRIIVKKQENAQLIERPYTHFYISMILIISNIHTSVPGRITLVVAG